MNRRLQSVGLVALAAVTALCVVGWKESPRAGASAPLPTSSPSFSTIWMSTVSVDHQGSHVDVQAGTFVADQAGNVRVRESYNAMGRSSATWVYDASSHAITRATNRSQRQRRLRSHRQHVV